MHRPRHRAAFLLTLLVALLTGCASVSPPPQSGKAATPPAPAATPVVTTALPNFGTPVATPAATLRSTITPLTIDLTAPSKDVWERIRKGYAMPNLDSPLVIQRQAWYLSRPDYLARMFERAAPYLFHVVEELEKRGMPTELALLPFVESAYNPMAYSRAHAAGMWQFIPSTGKNYNLRQDWWMDERRDILASTDAALTYLQTIYEMNGDWHLALASYNWGEGAVRRAIEKNRAAGLPTDYLSLSMPDETRYYVPKLQAIKNIISNPELFGIVLPSIGNEPYFATITKTRDIDVRTAAKLAEMPVEDFKALNPAFNRALIPGSTKPTTLLLPTDKVEVFLANLENHGGKLSSWQAYNWKRGDKLATVAKRYGMTVAELRAANGLGRKSKLKTGQPLLVRRPHSASDDEEVELEVAEAMADSAVTRASYTPEPVTRKSRVHTVRRGDTLFSIAKRYGVTVDQVKAVNRLSGSHIKPGMKISIPAAGKQIAARS